MLTVCSGGSKMRFKRVIKSSVIQQFERFNLASAVENHPHISQISPEDDLPDLFITCRLFIDTDNTCLYPPRSQVTFSWSFCLTPRGHSPKPDRAPFFPFFFFNNSVTHRPQTVQRTMCWSSLCFYRGFSGPSLYTLCQKDGNYQKKRTARGEKGQRDVQTKGASER